MPCELEEHVLERRHDGAEVGHRDPVFGETSNQGSHEVIASPANGVARVVPVDRFNTGDGVKAFSCRGIRRRQNHRAFRAVSANATRRRVDVDDPAVVDDGDAVAEAFGLFHQVRRQKDGLAAFADVTHQIPDGTPGLWIEPSGELIEEHHLGAIDECEGDEQPLFLPPRQRHKPGVPLARQSELVEQSIAIDWARVEGRPEVNRFPHLDAFLELRFLELDADPILETVAVPERIQ